jgi:hypothetical protein
LAVGSLASNIELLRVLLRVLLLRDICQAKTQSSEDPVLSASAMQCACCS